MQSIICTLFEGNYHYGVAALANSLYKHGFRGAIYAGYRGTLPDWVSSGKNSRFPDWNGGTTLEVTNDFKIHFLPLEIDWHLTNYKPNFMLQLWEGPAKDAESIFYFDPDIVNTAPWHFYQQWASFGVALVHEIALLDMPSNHPIRGIWRNVIDKAGLKVINNNLNSYFNGGFVGVSRGNMSFLHTWVRIFETGKAHFQLANNQWKHKLDRTHPFQAQDQDALNITAMCCDVPLSEMGPEAMGFVPGGWTMFHATGSVKPWNINFFKTFISGRKIAPVHKLYWDFAEGSVIKCYSKNSIRRKKILIKIYSLLNRFYGV
ncbi:MAG: hypothetical protein J7604_05745 [Sporocytophaga sp.]|uniref:hypothetical protein n=1 Tax=Sporocytophaga sp. TaxID=2231183 RepID=UPI001B18647C|nr:hypothetical protein [Sporocytophaga sp.]MBO9699694.1 hypothetical protein [Sporocytophaga sp.]